MFKESGWLWLFGAVGLGIILSSDNQKDTSIDLDNLDNQDLYLSDFQKRLLQQAKDLTDQNYSAQSCWHFIEAIFKNAGMTRITQLDFPWIGNQYTYKTRTIQSKPYMSPEEMKNSLIVGDWLYIHNKNTIDSKGNHSVLFLGWKDIDNLIAKTAEQRTLSQGGILNERNLSDQPVAHIMRMVG